MSIYGQIMWAVVLFVGVPSAWRNPTAAALLGSWAFTKTLYLVTGNGLAVDYYVFPDIVVLTVLFCKPEYRPCEDYLSTWHQLKCLVTERSPADRIVMLIFPIEWAVYVSTLSPRETWFALWSLSLVQFLAAGWESLINSFSMPSGESEGSRDFPTHINRLIEVSIATKADVLTAIAKADIPKPPITIPINAGLAAGISEVPLHVPTIRRSVHVPQIFNAVVARIAIDVVDLLARPMPMKDGPSNTVRVGVVSENRCLKLPANVALRSERFTVSETPVPFSLVDLSFEKFFGSIQPKEFPRRRLIAEKFAQRFRGGYFWRSHCAVPSREGQGRALFPQRFRPALCSISHPVPQLRAAECAFISAAGGGGDG